MQGGGREGQRQSDWRAGWRAGRRPQGVREGMLTCSWGAVRPVTGSRRSNLSVARGARAGSGACAGAAERPHEGREIPSRRAEVMAGGRCSMRGRCGEASEAPMRGPRGMRMRGQCGDAACAGKEAMLQQTCRGFALYGPASERPADRFSNSFSIGLRRRRRQTYVRT